MKKYNILRFIVLFAILLGTQNIFSQQVAKNYVVVEIGTGTWCPYCPGAAMGADDMVENGLQVAVIENHNGDSYTNSGSNARNNLYNISSFPTAVFNGQNPYVGGSHSNSLYAAYLPRYNAAIAVPSDFTLEMSYTNTGSDYDVTVELNEPGDYAETNLKVFLVLTESGIAQNWQGQDHLNFVNRAMFPNQNGTAYSGGQQTFNFSFTANANWNINNCELVALVQDMTTKEILQADKVSLLQPVGTNNIAIMDATSADSCNAVSTALKVNNLGSDEITSLSIDYSINAGAETGNTTWTGNLPFNEPTSILLDIPVADIQASNTIDYTITQVNGTSDDDDTNNTISSSFGEAQSVDDDYLKITIQTDASGDQCTWELQDSANEVVASGGPYGNNQTYHTELNLDADCYTFILHDAGGNGGTKFILKGTSGTLYYSLGDDYTDVITRDVRVNNLADVSDTAFAGVRVYPNPAQSILNIHNAAGLQVKIYDLLGRKIMMRNLEATEETLDMNALINGTYILELTDGVKSRIDKIVIAK